MVRLTDVVICTLGVLFIMPFVVGLLNILNDLWLSAIGRHQQRMADHSITVEVD
ncbi:MAG: hypothetical protein JO316_25380 [Abitibacteriaceae bacterium]|nr:hypothetical protein [Abditibacteriaceae bacterium]